MAVKAYMSVYMGLFQLLPFQRTFFCSEMRCSKILRPSRVHKSTLPALLRDNINSCAPSQAIYLKQHSVLSSSLQTEINISDVTSKRFAGVSHFSMRATYP
jgi:hypothetical protein